MMRSYMVGLAILVCACAPAMAGFTSGSLVTQYTDATGTHWTIDGAGQLLFEPTSYYNPSGPGSGVWDQNNMSPIDYPGVSPAYVPSPGNYGNYEVGEHTDLEGLFYAYDGDTGAMKVWLVTSVAPNGFTYNSFAYHVGDIFLDTDSDAAYEYALLGFGAKPGLASNHTVAGDNIHGSWNASNNRDAGDLVALNGSSILYGVNGPNSYAGNSTIRGLVNPWAVNNPATLLGGSDLIYQQLTGTDVNARDFAGGPGAAYWPSGTHSTYLYMWDVTLPETGLDYYSFDLHVVLQCGNDVIDGGIPYTPGPGDGVPAPGALILGMLGVGSVAAVRRRLGA